MSQAVPSKARRKASARRNSQSTPAEPNLKAALKLALELMAIRGSSGQEAEIANRIRTKLLQAGVPHRAIQSDQLPARSPLGGQIGNLICRLPGTIRAPRRLFMAHIDTVPLCVGSRPRQRNGFIESGNRDTALGADDRAGAAVILQTAIEIVRRRLPHPPLTFFWPVQEEVGLLGARFATLSLLGRPQLLFNFDGGPAEKVTLGATGAYRIRIRVEGIASHAGAAPEQGVSAIAIAAMAIADLSRSGWLGDVRKDGLRGTSNLGFIQGGGATNVIPDQAEIRGECRSHDPQTRAAILREIEQAFDRAAGELQNQAGQRGRVHFESWPAYESFVLDAAEPCVAIAAAAVKSIGREPQLAVSNGGLDANWMTARGMPTVTLGCGQRNAHMLSERLDVADFQAACRIALRLATAAA